MAAEYRVSGEKCRDRVRELREKVKTHDMTESEKLLLRRRITMLSAMARDAVAISKYLESYYERSCGKYVRCSRKGA